MWFKDLNTTYKTNLGLFKKIECHLSLRTGDDVLDFIKTSGGNGRDPVMGPSLGQCFEVEIRLYLSK